MSSDARKNILRRIFAAAVLGGASLLMSACTTVRWDGNPGHQLPRRQEPLIAPVSQEDAGITSVQIPKTVFTSPFLAPLDLFLTRDYKVERVTYNGSGGIFAVAHLYLPATPGPHPVIVIFPVLGGSYIPSEALARTFVDRNYAVLHMQSAPLNFKAVEDPAELVESFRRSIVNARTLIGWLENRPDIDRNRIGAAGVSLGGILASTLTGADERVDAGAFILAGGNLPSILNNSVENTINKFRQRVMGMQKLTPSEFQMLVRKYSPPLDPLRYAGAINPGKVMIISGRFDQVIQDEDTRALWQHMGKPTWTKVPSGHYSYALFFLWGANRAADHFDAVLGKDKTAPAIIPQPQP